VHDVEELYVEERKIEKVKGVSRWTDALLIRN
jgi:hypothetical protein